MEIPLTTQPMPQGNTNNTENWMPVPNVNFNCPPGLEYLTQVDQLLIHQKVELLEAMTGFQTANKYSVKNTMGQQVYFAVEDANFLSRNCLGTLRPFDLKIFDNFNKEVIHLIRPCRCVGCYPCCPQEIEVMSPPGTTIGIVRERLTFCVPTFDIKNAAGDTMLVLKPPVCLCNCCGDIDFPIYAKDEKTQIGKITKQWSGLAREMYTTADHFGINFPMDLDVNVKAVLLGALFLMDYLYFEANK